MPLWNESTSILPLDAFFEPRHAYSVKPEVPKSWTLEMDYSRAPCLGADQRTRGLWERDCFLLIFKPLKISEIWQKMSFKVSP